MAELFQTSRTNVIEHINNIYAEEELDKIPTCQNFRQVQKEGNRSVTREIPFYNLDMIISLGYRIKLMIKQRVNRVYHVGILYFYMYIKDKESDKMISIRKRGNVYQYCFEAGKVNGKRKQITKSGFKTKSEAYIAGQKAYDEFINGATNVEFNMLYGDYLDYWMKEYFEINYKYSTAKRYKESFSNIKKELGNYKLSVLTPYILNQTLLKLYQTSGTRDALRNYQKVIKSSLRDATYYFGFIKNNPAGDLEIPRILSFELKKQYRSHLYWRRNRNNFGQI